MKLMLIDILDNWISDVKLSFHETKQHSKLRLLNPMLCLPTGLLYLAASLRQKYGSGLEIKIVNTVIDCGSPEKLHALLGKFQPDVVGLRALSMHKTIVAEISRLIKEFNSDCHVIIGGPYPSSEKEKVFANKDIDSACVGEGEETIVDLVDALLAKKDLGGVAGILYRRGTEIISTPARPPVADLDRLAFPDYSLLNLSTYERAKNMCGRQNVRYASLVTSRGCPYRCIYCHNIFGKRFRARSPANIFAEIRDLHDTYGIKEYQILDDNFNFDERRTHEILDLIIDSGLDLRLTFPNGVRGDLLTKELIDKLIAAGTKYLYFAIETGSERLQKLIKKNLNLTKLMENINYASEKDCVTGGFFMLGFPTETAAEVEQTIEFAEATDLTTGYFFVVTYYPGSELYNLALEQGVDPEALRADDNFFRPKQGAYEYAQVTMEALYLMAHRRFYFSKKRIERALNKLPLFFSRKEIRDMFIAQITGAKMKAADIEDEACRDALKPYFEYAQRVETMGLEFNF